jgi:chromosomal replication initiation ATPase DnaA
MDEVVRNKQSEARRIGIHLLKAYTGASNREIGELFGGLSYSAVAKVNKNVERRLTMDEELADLVEGLAKANSLFKG